MAVYFIFDRHYFKAKDLRDYQELANIRKRYLAVVKSGDRFPWKTIADEEDMDLAAFKKILLVYAAIACGGQREQMAEFLSLEKDTLIVYLSEHHLTAATDQVKFAAEKIAAFKEAAARLEKMLDQDERSERRSQSEQSSSDAMVFLLELCVLEELLNELSLLVEINPHLYLYYTIMEAAMQQMETKIDNEIIVTEEHVLRELGQLAEDSLAALKEQDLSHRSIWKIILNS